MIERLRGVRPCKRWSTRIHLYTQLLTVGACTDTRKYQRTLFRYRRRRYKRQSTRIPSLYPAPHSRCAHRYAQTSAHSIRVQAIAPLVSISTLRENRATDSNIALETSSLTRKSREQVAKICERKDLQDIVECDWNCMFCFVLFFWNLHD